MNAITLSNPKPQPGEVRAALVAIRDDLTPNRWCQKVPARNRRGYRVEPTDSTAVKYCLFGKLRSLRLSPDLQTCAMYKLNAVAWKRHRMTAPLVNDKRGHGVVMELLEEAIGNCQAAPGGSL